jgi:hypothetical protein
MEKCAHSQISYNSCRNRHCPKCQGAAAKDWLAARQADLLPVQYYHVVFTLPAAIRHLVRHDQMVHGVDRDLRIVADDARATPTRCHRTAVGSLSKIWPSGEANICFS